MVQIRALRVLSVAALSLTGCEGNSSCSSDVAQVTRDPGSDRYASTEMRNCGATTDYATVVRVGRADESQDHAVEVFVADSNHGKASDGGGGMIWTSVVWVAPGQLKISYASRARVFKRLETAKQASIAYHATDPIASRLVD